MSDYKAPLWTKSFSLLFVTNYLMWFGVAFLIPTFPLFALDLGVQQSHIGFLTGSFNITSVLIRPFGGYAYDSYNKKTIFLLSLIFFTLVSFSYPLSTTFFVLIMIRMLHGLVFGVASTGGVTILADIVHPKRRSEGVGLFGLGNTLSMAMSPAIGLWVASNYGFTVLFIVCGIFIGSSVIMSFFINYPQTVGKTKVQFSWKACVEKRVLSVAGLVLVIGTIFGGLLTFIAIFSEEIGIANGGIYFLLNSVGVAVPRLFAGKIQDQKGPNLVVTFGLIVLALGLFALGGSKEIYLFSAASVLIGLGMGTVMPALQAMVIDMVEPRRRSVGLATFAATIDIGIFAGSVMLGWVAQLTSLGMMYFICGLSVAIPFIVFHLFVLKDYETKANELADVGINVYSADTLNG